MTSEDYLWYSKAVLLTIATLTFVGVFIRWKTESQICKPLAYMSLLLAAFCITDIIVCQNFDYHPLMLKSGRGFGILFFVLAVIAFSYLYVIELFKPVKVTFKLLLRLNWALIISLSGYIVLSVFNIELFPDYDLRHTSGGLNTNALSLWWLITTLSVLVYALFVGFRAFRWTMGSITAIRREHPEVATYHCYGLLIPYVLFGSVVVLLCVFSLFRLEPAVEAPGFIFISVILFLIYIYTHFYSEVHFDKKDESAEHKEDRSETLLSDKQEIRAHDRLLIEKLTRLMEQDELYKSKDLTTEVLARHLGISRKKLYLFLKEHYNSTFSDYINGLRLESAEKLMSSIEHIDLSITRIAEMSGFNSVKTFNKFFKAKHDTTPTKYRNSIDF